VKRSAAIIACLLAGCFLTHAQNLNGFWKGSLTMRGCFGDNNIELQLTVTDNKITGDSYHYQDVYNYVKKKIKGSYDAATKRLTVIETIVTTHHIPLHCVICIKTFELQYKKEGELEFLEGIWHGNVMNTGDDCRGGTITLSRIAESAFKEIPEIKVDTGTLKLDFYDNAVIDGDIITVRVNNKVVASNQLLSAKPITLFVTIDLNNKFQEVEMIAENLGSIPPNTALLIVTAGKKRYRLYLTSTESKNAMVRFVYDPDAEGEETNLEY
jgi:hypothetical protein